MPSNAEDRIALEKAFRANRINVHLTGASFLDGEKIWVSDDDFARAQEIVHALASRRSRWARAENDELPTTWKGRLQWLKDRDAMFWCGLFIALVMIFGFAVLPLWEAL